MAWYCYAHSTESNPPETPDGWGTYEFTGTPPSSFPDGIGGSHHLHEGPFAGYDECVAHVYEHYWPYTGAQYDAASDSMTAWVAAAAGVAQGVSALTMPTAVSIAFEGPGFYDPTGAPAIITGDPYETILSIAALFASPDLPSNATKRERFEYLRDLFAQFITAHPLIGALLELTQDHGMPLGGYEIVPDA